MASYFATLWNRGLTQLEKGQLPRTIQVKFRRIMNYLYGVITNLHRHADFWQVDTFVVNRLLEHPKQSHNFANSNFADVSPPYSIKAQLESDRPIWGNPNWIPPRRLLNTEFRNLCQWNLDSGFQSLMEFWIPWAELFSGFQSPGFQFPALKFSGFQILQAKSSRIPESGFS